MAKAESITWKSGFAGLLNEWNLREEPFASNTVVLPDVHADLAILASTPCPPPAANFTHQGRLHYPSRMQDVHVEMSREYVAQSALCLMTAQLIPVFRRRNPADEFIVLWHRVWAEQAQHLLDRLSSRWKISAIQTFAELGETETERLLGCEAVQFFGMLKIFEAERKTSGLPSWKIFSFGAKNRGPMPLKMEPFSLEDGDLDRYLVMRLFQLCQSCQDTPVSWLVMDLLNALNTDSNNIFHRLAKVRGNQNSDS
ncbi:hypothetical protein [Halocynthiibacter namhaensis]|uniref:hypothetical protein n=1 Tax=Halocynthiibacter namhaensis TaxID=1290553 RepID=UPI00057975C3|nr:hypothetical protein [Halocynthiibacter namhaensis]